MSADGWVGKVFAADADSDALADALSPGTPTVEQRVRTTMQKVQGAPANDLDDVLAELAKRMAADRGATPRMAPVGQRGSATHAQQRGTLAKPVPVADLRQYVAPWTTTAPKLSLDRFAIGRGAGGMFPLGYVSTLGAPGGTLKTALMILLGMRVAAGAPFAGHDVAPGAVLFLSLEDGADEMARRVGAAAVTAFPDAETTELQKRFGIIAMAGADGRFTSKAFSYLAATELAERLTLQAKLHAEACGMPVRLIVVDHARLAMSGDVNDSEAVTLLTRTLTHVAAKTGAAVVLKLTHFRGHLTVNKEGVRYAQEQAAVPGGIQAADR